MEALMSSPDCRVQGFLAAGHVCAVMGYEEYLPHRGKISRADRRHRLRAAGHSAGRADGVQQLESGRAEVENQYTRAVRREGNQPAQELIREVFRVVPRKWRGVGEIPQSGLGLSEAYAAFDAEQKFGVADRRVEEPAECLSGLVLQGLKSSRTNAPPSARAARRNIRSARRWFPPKARARPITAIAGVEHDSKPHACTKRKSNERTEKKHFRAGLSDSRSRNIRTC